MKQHVAEDGGDERPGEVTCFDGCGREEPLERCIEHVREIANDLGEPSAASRTKKLEREAHGEERVEHAKGVIDDLADTSEERCARGACGVLPQSVCVDT